MWRGGRNRDMLAKDTRLELCRMNKLGDLMYSIMTIAKNTVLNTGDLPRVDLRSHTHKGNYVRRHIK